MVIFAYRQVLILLCIRKLAPTRKKEKGERRRAPRQEGWNKKRCKRRKDHTHRHRHNRVGGKRKFSSYFRFPTSHTTVRAVRHTAVPHCSVQFDIVVHKARVTCSA